MLCATVSVARRLLGKVGPEEDVQDYSSIVHGVRFDNRKSKEVLGLIYHDDVEATATFIIKHFKLEGWC